MREEIVRVASQTAFVPLIHSSALAQKVINRQGGVCYTQKAEALTQQMVLVLYSQLVQAISQGDLSRQHSDSPMKVVAE